MIFKAILLGVLQVTSYCPRPQETRPECKDRWHCTTANGDGITMYGCAVSQDYLRSGVIKYGDIIYVEKYGLRVVNDCLNARYVHSVDLLVFEHWQEKAIGVRHLRVWVISPSPKTEIAKRR